LGAKYADLVDNDLKFIYLARYRKLKKNSIKCSACYNSSAVFHTG